MNKESACPKAMILRLFCLWVGAVGVLGVASAQAQIPEVKLTASDAAAYGGFGGSVSISGDTAVIGEGEFYLAGHGPKSAYVFTRLGGVWTQEAKLTASDAIAGDIFGWSVSVAGDTAAVGAISNNVGAVYVFTRNHAGWTQQAKLSAADQMGNNDFGQSLAVSGDTVVIGAPGSAYVFTRSGWTWTLQQKLDHSDTTGGAGFGDSVSVAGDTAVVGADYDSEGGASSGSAYVFTRSGAVWSQQAKLVASDSAAGDSLGYSVSVSTDTVVVGAYQDDDGGLQSGSAYVFARSGSTWIQQAKLTASDATVGDNFGYSVSVCGDTAAVGARFDCDARVAPGSTYVFTRSGEVWSQRAKLTAADSGTGDQLGTAVAVGAGRIVAGAPYKRGVGLQSGAAYVFDLTPSASSFSINGGTASTDNRSVTLNNACTNSPTLYLASESPAFSGASWQPYSAAPTFTLSPVGGTKTVYFKARNTEGDSAVVSDTIRLDAAAVWMLSGR